MSNQPNNDKPKLEEAGALWKKKAKNSGNTYLTGRVKTKDGQEINVLVFPNTNKVEGSQQPDYRIYFDNPRTEGATRQSSPPPAAPQKPLEDDDIPF